MDVSRALAPLLAALFAAGCVLAPGAPEEPPPGAGSLDGASPAPAPSREGDPLPTSLPRLEGLGGREGPTREETPPREPTAPAGNATASPPTQESPAPTPATPPPAAPVPANPPGPTPAPSPPAPSGGASRPVRFEAGADAQPSRYVERFALAPGATSFAADLRGVPGARVHAPSLFLLRNDADAPFAVRLVAEGGGAPPGVDEARLTLRAPGSEPASLDLRSPGATLDLALPPRSVLEAAWTLTLGPDASASFSWGLRMVVEG